jgi:hypothetical protein
MISTATQLNISCSCTECNIFLRPISYMNVPNKAHDIARTKTRLTNLRSTLPIITTLTSMKSYPSASTISLPTISPFVPKTPGLLRCTHASCIARIPVTAGFSYGNTLCHRHNADLRNSVKVMVESWAGNLVEKRVARPAALILRQISREKHIAMRSILR